MSEEKKNIRIIDIARIAGVSSGTVDRVLHNRGKVSKEKREKIEKVLQEINYQPNIIARSLAMKRHYTILVMIPYFEAGGYWDVLNSGIARAGRELENFNIDIEYLFFKQYEEDSFAGHVRKMQDKKFDAVLIAALFKQPTAELSKLLDEKEIPYVFIDSNIMDQNNLAYFGADSYNSGAVAAKLMMYETGKENDLFIAKITTNNKKDSAQTYIREQGFRDYLGKNGYQGNIHSVELSDDYTTMLRRLSRLQESAQEVIGGVVFNSRIHELASILFSGVNHGYSKVKLIGYDAIEKNLEALKKGHLAFLLSQRSEMQGYNGVKTLSNYLLLGKKTEKTHYMPIDILIKENLHYYNNNLL